MEKYEAALNRVSPGCIYRFARLLSVPVAYFFEDLPRAAIPSPARHDTMVLPDNVFQLRETRDLVKAYYAISDPARRRAVQRLIRSMSQTSRF